MRHRTPQILLATAAVAALAAAPASAQTDPYSEAGATAVEIDGVASISSTEASTQDDGSADATVLELGGEQVVGGSQEGPGENAGEILTTGEDNEQGFLTVGSHQATVEENRSYARTAVVDGNLGGEEGISATVLESESEATESSSSAETTGAELDLGGQLRLRVLHAYTGSDGEGGSYVLGVNDEQILSSEQADGQCEIPADPLLNLLCLYADAVDGGEGTDGLTGGNAGFADFTALDENLTGRAFEATATSGPADGETATAAPAGDDAPAPAPAPADDDAAAAPGELPRTGAGLLPGLLGLAAMGAGEGLRRFGKR